MPGGPGFPAHYDVFATGGGIAAGDHVAGFTVRRVNWLGSGTPTAPPYEIMTTTLATLEQGTTSLRAALAFPSPP